MEIINPYSDSKDMADAIKGYWGKEVSKDCTIVYCGQVMIGIGDVEVLEKKCAARHYDWEQIGGNIYIAVIK